MTYRVLHVSSLEHENTHFTEYTVITYLINTIIGFD